MTTEANPVVSVVSGVYNAGRYLLRSAESVLAQEGVSWEWVVIDDGSTDGSSELLTELARRDARLRVHRQTNQGLTKALIRGCELCGDDTSPATTPTIYRCLDDLHDRPDYWTTTAGLPSSLAEPT